MPAPLRLAVLSVFALALAACATAEDYLTSINPFRRADQAAAPPPLTIQQTPQAGAPTPQPPARPSETPR